MSLIRAAATSSLDGSPPPGRPAGRALSRCLLPMLATSALAGCGNPYALNVSGIDYSRPQTAGSVQVSDPKMYRREALIDERRKEIAYLDKLLNDSPGINFQPEIIRELEQISSLAAAIGVQFDPAAALNYNRAKEIGDIRQEISVTRSRAELLQIQRDLDILKEQIKTQEIRRDETLGANTSATPEAAQSNVGEAATQRLVKAVEAMQTMLENRFGASVPSPRLSSIVASPFDLFRDRAAYRGLITSAKNAASLDELHDYDSSALLRLNFQATVLPPDAKYLASVGVVKMSVEPPDWKDETEIKKIYLDWLAFLNKDANYFLESGKGVNRDIAPILNPRFLFVLDAYDYFKTAYYNYTLDKTTIQNKDRVFRAVLNGTCDGVSARPKAGCQTLYMAVPFLGQTASTGIRSEDVSFILDAMKTSSIPVDLANAISLLSDPAASLSWSGCRVGIAKERLPTASDQQKLVQSGLRGLNNLDEAYATTQVFVSLEAQARSIFLAAGIIPPAEQPLSAVPEVRTLLDRLARRRHETTGTGCTADFADSTRVLAVPKLFSDFVRGPARVAIYEVGPREQVQQISTTARAAEAIGLAAAIGGKLPQAGLGIDSNLQYARSAMGKVDALERAPVVVGFADAPGSLGTEASGNPLKPAPSRNIGAGFGWLLGPRASVDAKRSRLRLEQQLKPYDLSVDLTVPAWWPYFFLKTETAWSPNWKSAPYQIATPSTTTKRTKVYLSHNSADYVSFSNRLTGLSDYRVASLNVKSVAASWCKPTVVAIRGDNIWRASTVIVGGTLVSPTDISVLPDMSGIIVKIPELKDTAVKMADSSAELQVFTPYGSAGSVEVTANPEECPKASGSSAKPTDGPAITSADPPFASVCAPSAIHLTGTKLDEADSVMIGAGDGKIEEIKGKDGKPVKNDGKLIRVAFSESAMRSADTGNSATLTLRKAGVVIASTTIELRRPTSCKGS
jgi:hypothetical protein